MKERTALHYEYRRNEKSFSVSCLLQDGNTYDLQLFYELVLQKKQIKLEGCNSPKFYYSLPNKQLSFYHIIIS